VVRRREGSMNMRVIMASALVTSAIACGFVRSDEPRASLSVGDALRVDCGPGATAAELRSVSTAGVQELKLVMLRIEGGVSTDLRNQSFTRAKGAAARAADRGQLVLLLRKEEGLLLPSVGLQFNGTGLSAAPLASGETSKIRRGDRSGEYRRPAGELPAGKRVILYALVEGGDKRGEPGLELGKLPEVTVEKVEELSKRHKHLSFLLVVVSWSAVEGR